MPRWNEKCPFQLQHHPMDLILLPLPCGKRWHYQITKLNLSFCSDGSAWKSSACEQYVKAILPRNHFQKLNTHNPRAFLQLPCCNQNQYQSDSLSYQFQFCPAPYHILYVSSFSLTESV